MYTIIASYEGLAPMMHDKFYNQEELESPRKKHAAATWRNELPLKLYQDKRGVYLPADNIRMMLIGNKDRPGAAKILGSYIETGKKGTELKNLCQGCIWVAGLDDPLKVYLYRDGKIIKWPANGKEPEIGVDYDERSFPSTSGRHLTRRPIILTPWMMQFTIQVTDDQVDASRVRQLFDVAGLRSGAGAYGPTFGRCIIQKWEPQNRSGRERS